MATRSSSKLPSTNGEVWQDAEGLWWNVAKTELKADRIAEVKRATKTREVASEDWASAVQDMIEDINTDEVPHWLLDDEEDAERPRKRLKDGSTMRQSIDLTSTRATDHQMRLLQESFDSVTRMTMAINKMATEIMGNLSDKALGGGNAKEMARRGLQMLKDLVEPTQKIEELLVTERDEIDGDDVENVLETARPPYKAVLDYYADLRTIYQAHVFHIW